jgi:uncharacterized delta-60 repeat protein
MIDLLENRIVPSNDPSLTLTVNPHTIAENAGAGAATGTVSRVNMDVSQALTVSLSSSNTAQATVPASVTIPAGATSASFGVDAVDNHVVDPTQTVTITGSAPSPVPAGADATFGGTGYASVPLKWSNSANVPDAKVQADGKIVTVAASPTSGATWAVARTNADGTPDTAFGSGGAVTTTFPGSTGGYANGIALQPDGKIVVVGTVTGVSVYDAWGIARYNANGTPDTTFGTGGLLLVKFTGEGGDLYDAAVQADGKILVGGTRQDPNGFVVARLTSTGQIDTAFGAGGYASLNPDPADPWYNTTGQAMTLQSDGKILLTGIANYKYLAVARFNAGGTVDTTFSGTGVGLVPLAAFGPSYTSIAGTGLAVQADGKIVVVGQAFATGSPNYDWAIARFNPNGSLDTGFSGDGVATVDFAGGTDYANDVTVQADGKIVVAGSAGVGGTTQFSGQGYNLALVRYNPDGTLDASFHDSALNHPGEYVFNGLPSVFEEIWGVDLQPDGKLAAVVGYNTQMDAARFDLGLLAGSDSLSVTDTDGGPTANAGGPYTVPEGGTVTLDASGTTDPFQDPATLTYAWDLDGDGVYGETGAGAQRGDEVGIHPTFSAAGLNGPGSVVVHLRVTDAQGLSSIAEAHISITNVAPTVSAGGNAAVNDGDTFSRSGSFTDPGPDTWTGAVDYGDGSGIQPLPLNADKTFTISHHYQDEGAYKVTVSVSDGDGGVGSSSFTVTVNDVTPVVLPGSNVTVDEGTTFTGAGSFTDASPDTWTATVDYGDGSGPQPLTLNADKTFSLGHLYTDEGPYTVTVTVTDDDGVSGVGTLTVTVDNPAPVVSAGGDATLNEGASLFRNGSFADPGADTWTATVDYGDGSGPQPLTLNADKTFTLQHAYNDEGSYTVSVTVADDDGVAGSASFTVNVNDTAPQVLLGSDLTLNEGGQFSELAHFTDPGPDTWTATVDYGDGGGTRPLTLNANQTFGTGHGYADNGVYTVTVTVTDDEGVSGVATYKVTVNDVPPTAGVSGPAGGVRGQARTFTLTAQDVSPVDQAAGFTYTIEWGDGSTGSAAGPSGTQVSHVYTASGSYTVKVSATDKDGLQSTQPASTAISVTAAALQGGDLVVGGTTGADTIVIKPADTAGDLAVVINGATVGTYKPTGQIVVYAQAGNDAVHLQTAKFGKTTVAVSVPALLFGGDGNDTLDASGSTANNILLGGAGNDTLTAGSGRDILISGPGADVLHAGGGGDILIGGTTDWDANLTALAALRAEWGRTDLAYQDRINHLDGTVAGGLNGSYLLNAQTAHDDGAKDQLDGGGGIDWFFAGASDGLGGRKRGEVVTTID